MINNQKPGTGVENPTTRNFFVILVQPVPGKMRLGLEMVIGIQNDGESSYFVSN